MNHKKNAGSTICFGISIITLFLGLYKLLVYRPNEVFKKGINSYSAKWNIQDLMLNTNIAIAMFILTLIFVILGIYFSLDRNKN